MKSVMDQLFEDAVSDLEDWDAIRDVTPPSDSGSYDRGEDNLADPSAWALPSGQAFVGFHDNAQGVFDRGPWVSGLASGATTLGSATSLYDEAFLQGQFVHGIGGGTADEPFALTAWPARSATTEDYDRQGIYAALGCPDELDGGIGTSALLFSWSTLGDVAQVEENDVVSAVMSADVVANYIAPEPTGNEAVDAAAEEAALDEGYLLTPNVILGTISEGDTVVFVGTGAGGPDATISGRFAVTGDDGAGSYYLRRLSGEGGELADAVTAGQADPRQLTDTGYAAAYSYFASPDQPTIAASSNGTLIAVWIESGGPYTPLEAVNAHGETPTVSLVLRRGTTSSLLRAGGLA